MIRRALLAVAMIAPPAAAQQLVFRTPGADDDLRESLRSASLLVEATDKDDAAVGDVLAAARAEYGRLVGALYAEAHYGGVVNVLVDGREAATIPPLQRPSEISRIVVTVDPGPVYDFSRAVIAPLAPGTTLPDGYARGEPARAERIKDAVSAGISGWRAVGHAKAEAAGQEITADHATDALSATVRLAPGPRVRFGDLAITGNERVRTARIREIAGFPTGEVFSPEALNRAAARLQRTGAFSSVALREADTLGPDDSLDVTAAVTEEEPRRFGFGAELSTSEGLALNAFWLHRNLRGGAERLRIEGQVSGIGGDKGGIDYDLGARFDRPATFTPDTGLFLEAGAERLDEPEFTTDTAALTAGVTHIFSPQLRGETGVSLSYSRAEDDLGERNFTLLSFPSELTWDRRNSDLDPTDGTYLDTELRPYIAFDDADTGARLYVDGRTYEGFGPDDRVVVAGRAQLGSILGSDLRDTRPDFLFFSGGAGTVRGQDFQSLGVELDDGDRIGGRSFLGLSGELRVRVTEKIGVVGFYDAGYVGEDSLPGGDSEMHSGAGLGLRYATGIGPIRLDVATPVSGEEDDGSVQVYVGIGQAF